MLIGAMKCGTSNLAAQLKGHSNICFCKEKEPHYFSTTDDWTKHIDQYLKLYKPTEGQICGEASTSYSFLGEYPQVAERLYSYNPDLKLIFIVRNPVDRIRSHYSHRLMQGIANTNPDVEIEKNEKAYINRSCYGHTVQEYLKFFPANQLLVLDFMEYITAPGTVTKRVCDYLEIPYENIALISAKNTTSGSNRTPLSPIFYLDKLLSYSPPALRRILSRFIDVKLHKKPAFSKELELKLWDRLGDDITLLKELTTINVIPWREKQLATTNKK